MLFFKCPYIHELDGMQQRQKLCDGKNSGKDC